MVSILIGLNYAPLYRHQLAACVRKKGGKEKKKKKRATPEISSLEKRSEIAIARKNCFAITIERKSKQKGTNGNPLL